MKPHIRIASGDDLDALLSLEKICFKEETFHKKQLKYLLLKAKSVVLIAEIKGKIIGSIIILLRKTILKARVYSLNVHPEYRRLGIASSIMDSGMDISRKRGYEYITLEVGINNQAAQDLYRSKGFVVDKTLYNYYKNGDDALHLARKL